MKVRRPQIGSNRVSRRSVLAGGAGLGVAAVTGCQGGFAPSGDSGTGDDLQFAIPDAPPDFPTEDVTLRLIDSNDTKAPYWKGLFPAYEAKFENVTCSYDGLPWNRIDEIVPLGFRSGSAHDLIQLPGSIPLPQAVSEGWVAPFDDYIPDFDNWRKTVAPEVQTDGVQVFDGKLYSVAVAADRRYNCALHFHRQLVNDAGFDPQSEPFTWDTFREAARKITEQANGQAYGLILEIGQPGRLGLWINYLARIAGLRSVGNILQPSGEFDHASDEIVGAIELLKSIQADGSIFPGSNSLSAPECWPRVARGNAAMVGAGPWVTVQWESENPDFDFGVAPAPGPADRLPVGYPVTGGDSFVLASTSKVKEVAGHLIDYVTSLDGQTNWGKIAGVGNPPQLAEAREASAAEYPERSKLCHELAQTMTASPSAVIANADVALVARREKPISPNFGEVIQQILVGEVDDVRKAMTDVRERAEKARDAAIAEAAKRDGSTATRQDWIYRNWDPTKDYTKQDYAGR